MCEKVNENRNNFARIRTEFLRHLTANDNVTDLSKRFSALNSNVERVNFVAELLKSAKIGIDFQRDQKNDTVAIKLREQGNDMFKIKKLKEAWEFYTKSICFAGENSVNLGLAYGNRSAVLFEVGLHKECLTDINRALDHSYPESRKSKLLTRQENSKNLVKDTFQKTHEDVPTVEDKNPKIQCASSCLGIQEDASFGRYVVATKDIKAGEILAIEKSFALLLVNQYLSHCHECVSLCYNLVPCKGCTQALYCSENCKQEAFQRYHKYECPILSTIRFLELDKLKVLPLKIAFLVKNNYSNIGVLDNDCEYRSDHYKEIHNLVANTSKRSVSDLFERAIAAAVIFQLVKNHTNFFDIENCKLEEDFKEILLLHMQTGPSNFHEITELAPNPSGTYEPEEIASGAFAFLSLLNHSCCPNVTRFCYGSSIVLRAIQDIKKGEQCFDNYGYHHALMGKKDRQTSLQSQYYFDCICQACENNWPLYDALPSVGDVEFEESQMVKLSTGDIETAKIVLPAMLAKLGELQKMQPCKSFCQMQEIVKQCFAVFGNKRQMF